MIGLGKAAWLVSLPQAPGVKPGPFSGVGRDRRKLLGELLEPEYWVLFRVDAEVAVPVREVDQRLEGANLRGVERR